MTCPPTYLILHLTYENDTFLVEMLATENELMLVMIRFCKSLVGT